MRVMDTETLNEVSKMLQIVDEIIYEHPGDEKTEQLIENMANFATNKFSESIRYGKPKTLSKFEPVHGLQDTAATLQKRKDLITSFQIYEKAQADAAMAEAEAKKQQDSSHSASLSTFDEMVIRDLPQYYSAGWKLMLRESYEMRKWAKSERIYNKITSENLMRLAGMVKNIGWNKRVIENGENRGKYYLVNFDRPDPDAKFGHYESNEIYTYLQANKKLKELNKDLKKPTDAEIALGKKVLQAITAEMDNPTSEDFVTGVSSDKKTMYYLTYTEDNKVTTIGDKRGYATREAAEEAKSLIADAYTSGDKVAIESGYKLNSRKIEDIKAEIGRDRYDAIKKMAQEAIARAEKYATKAWEHVLEKDLDQQHAEFKSIFAKLKRGEDNKQYTNIITAVALKGKMPIDDGNVATVLESWGENTWNSIINTSAVVMGTTTMDSNGDPAWIARFNTNDDVAKYNPMTEKQMGIALQAAVNTVNRMRMEEGQQLFSINKNLKAKDEMKRLFSESGDLISKEYEAIDAKNTNYVATFWVKRKNKDKPEFMFGTGEKKMLGKIEAQKASANVGKFDIMNGFHRINSWGKFGTLGFSMFHPFSLMESLVAIQGVSFQTYRFIVQPKSYVEMSNMAKRAAVDAEWVADWTLGGLELSTSNPNIDTVRYEGQQMDVVSRDLRLWEDTVLLKYPSRIISKYKNAMDRLLWGKIYPGIKLYGSEFVLNEIRKSYNATGQEFNRQMVIKEISPMLNEAFGGMNWDKYIWSNKRSMQMIQLMGFAPDWSAAAFGISGAPNLPGLKNIIRDNQTDLQKDWQLKKYWPGMLAIVMTAIPQSFQGMIYSLGQVLPGDDDDKKNDHYFTALNEKGKSGMAGIGASIDMTPLLRHLGWVPGIGYEGGDTGKRRVYMEVGKQAREVADWFTSPLQTLKHKTSTTVQLAFEQLTNQSVGGWDIGDRKLLSVVEKFAPMSIMAPLEGRPSTVLAPIKRGITKKSAELEYAKLLKVYGDQRTMNKIASNDKYLKNLAALDNGILEAAAANGIDPIKVVNKAKSIVTATYYEDFFEALNNEDYGKLERIADKIVRINGTAEGAIASMKSRSKTAGTALTPRDVKEINKAFGKEEGQV